MDRDKIQEIMALEESGKLEEALSELRKLAGTSADPEDNSLAFSGIARCLSRLGHYDQARVYVRKAYSVLDKVNLCYPSAMFIDASIEEEAGKYEEALAKLDSIIKDYPDIVSNPDYE